MPAAYAAMHMQETHAVPAVSAWAWHALDPLNTPTMLPTFTPTMLPKECLKHTYTQHPTVFK